AEVYTNTVTGKIDEIYNNEIEVNGTVYKVYDENKNEPASKYIEDGKTETFDSSSSKNKDTLESFQKGGEVTLFLDRNGDVSYLTGELGDVVSSTLGSYLLEDAVGYKQ